MFSKLKKLKKATKKDEQEFREMIREETEKNDGLAMAIAAFITIVLPCLLLLLVLGGVMLLLFS